MYEVFADGRAAAERGMEKRGFVLFLPPPASIVPPSPMPGPSRSALGEMVVIARELGEADESGFFGVCCSELGELDLIAIPNRAAALLRSLSAIAR